MKKVLVLVFLIFGLIMPVKAEGYAIPKENRDASLKTVIKVAVLVLAGASLVYLINQGETEEIAKEKALKGKKDE